LANLSYLQANGLMGEEKTRKLDESKALNERLISADPQNKEAYYSLGRIAWAKSKPAFAEMRERLGMKPEDPGPLPDAAVRQQLKSEYSAILDDGIANVEKALVVDPAYCGAMTYMNLLIRKRADLRDTKDDYESDQALADQWMKRASAACPPRSAASPSIRVAGKVQEVNLIHKVGPEYPPLAKQARIQGAVRFSVTIGKDGRVQSLELISGHPLLVTAAKDAVKQWEYKPTPVNGEPTDVLTTVAVDFHLPPPGAVN
jgi:TonB family protein